jgi:F-type H+-transporting ATPase subunit epsilon
MAILNCVVVTPEQTALEARAHFIVLPMPDGEIGLAGGRAPMIGRLGFGEMRVRFAGQWTRYYIDGGFVQVSGNVVSVITERAIPASQVDADAARRRLEEARGMSIATPELEQIRDRLVARARAQIRVAARA